MKDRYLRFTGLMTDIMRNVRRITSDAISHYEIKRSYVPCIYFLYKNGPLTAARLCKLCDEDKANISRTLRALEDDGYAVKEERASSRSPVRMTLTETGREIGEFLAARVNSSVELATSGIDPDDIETMYSVLERIRENLSVLHADD